ncbi:hypothetical protein ACN1C3_01380 [Pseudomonas sp. H11T01]|uniref:hypothetical protein n=1 Tax=Pseudomonas sp. H11T01 TaxID=3402749 RepID=UPI003AC68E28
MVILVSSTLLSNNQTPSISIPSTQTVAVSNTSATARVTEDTRGTSTLSSLAQQLSESATRAEARDASLSRRALGAKATELFSQITGDRYFANKAKNDAEIPNTENPELLARAKKATQHVSGGGTNPFAGLSRDQLALITYDDSGTFTINERRAAWSEAFDQESAWGQMVVARAMAEYNSTGKLTHFFTAVLDHYKTLPSIEQAQYPDSYETQLQGWIDLDFNYWTHTVEGHGSPQSVLDKVLDQSAFSESESAISAPKLADSPSKP